ncbi:cytochrome-c peroxidase [Rhodoplanes azumiensis]|uniref:Cytochrome-c peroxidase n=1 Tax=Rhodoplanes azumiensis TaxID=1897628 RepID=A0ABW5ADV5_9BRAD
MIVDLSDLLPASTLAVGTAAAVLVLLVRHDLVPAGRLVSGSAEGRRWLLGGTLGIGVIAFALKTAIIVAVAALPHRTIAPLTAAAHRPERPADAADPAPRSDALAAPPPGRIWRPLPAVAPAPPDNPTTPEKAALGERLFHDPILSLDRTVSCASCHDVRTGAGADGRATGVGVGGAVGRRNVPTVWNAAFQARLFWDGRAGSLEEQAIGPLFAPDEMAMPSGAVVEARITADPSYREAFARAFGDDRPVTLRRVLQAIAAYERTLVAADTPYDRFVAGDADAMTPAQTRGMWLFGTIGCTICHAGANFSGASLVGPKTPYAALLTDRSEEARRRRLADDKGRARPGEAHGVWRIPSLRNVALTAPYFHNGRVDDLHEAVRIMATAQLNITISDDSRLRRRPVWSPEDRTFSSVDRIVLDRRDIDDLVAFLHALSSDRLAARVTARPTSGGAMVTQQVSSSGAQR